MLQFDVASLPPEDGQRDLVISANAVIRMLYQIKVATVPRLDPETSARLSSVVRIYIQSHLRRLIMFLEGGLHEHEQKRPLFTITAARSMYESIASFHDFSAQICKLLDQNEFKEAANLLRGRAFATRLPEHLELGQSNEAENGVTRADRLPMSLSGFKNIYNRMSEFVHPDTYGSLVQFHSRSRDGQNTTFYDNGKPTNDGLTYLISASLLSVLFLINVAQIENRLKDYSLAKEPMQVLLWADSSIVLNICEQRT